MKKLAAAAGVLLLCVGIGSMLGPGCVIRIGPGTSGETQPDPTGGVGGAGSAGGGPSDEQATIEAFQNVDPHEAILKVAAGEYAAAACSSLVQSQVADPGTVDPTTVQQLFEQYAPAASDVALAWMASVDPSTLNITPKENVACMNPPYECDGFEFCSLGDGATCMVTGCGHDKCSWCNPFGNLIYNGYCTYACMQGSKYWGYGFNLRTIFHNWTGFVCFPFPK